MVALFASTGVANAGNGKVLILEPTVSGGLTSLEAQAAVEAGQIPELASPAQWEAMTTAQFAAYDAVILGDPTCQTGEGPIAAADANAATWNPAITGKVIVIGTDPVFHQGIEGARKLIKQGIALSVEDKTRTGAYIDLSCYYALSGVATPVPMLANMSSFGGFKVFGQHVFSACPANSHIVATSPALTGLTDADLSNWSCSAHEAFEEWPADFQVLVINSDIGKNYTASDGTVGGPYILARGTTVISNIKLTPLTAENPVGAPHTVTATVTENEKPVVGTTVTFTVIAGPNTGVTGTGITNANGEATFTYTSKVTGTDVLHATFVDAAGHTETSNTVEKTWTAPKEECTTVIGSGQFRVGAEVQTVDNEVTTSGSKHVFEYAWENRTQHLRLTKLESASCVSNGTESKFTGHGKANVNNVKGYEITFTFTISGGKTNLVLVLEKEKAVVRTFTDEPLIVTKLQRERIF